jgi:hypothetical protein
LLIKLNSGEPISAAQPRTSFFATCGGEGGLIYCFVALSVTTQITQDEGVIIVTIAATKLYRSLINIYSSDM